MVDVLPDYSSAMLPYLQQLQDQDSGRAPTMSGPNYGGALSQRFGVGPAGFPTSTQDRFKPNYAGTSNMMLDPAMAGLNEMDPEGAQGRADLQGAGLKAMASSALPAITTGARFLGNALAPAGAGEPSPQAAVAKSDRLQQLDQMIADEIKKKNAALKAAETQSNSRVFDKNTRTSTKTTTTNPVDEAMAARISEGFDKNISNWQGERESLLPWMQTAPAWERSLIEHAPEISFGFGTGAGLLTKNPWLAMGMGGIGSAAEGAFASAYPTIRDMHLPDQSPAGQEARRNWDSRDWWLHNVLPETGAAMTLGAIGGKTGNLLRQAGGQIGSGVANLFRGSQGAPSAPTSASIPGAPTPTPPQSPQVQASTPPWSAPKVAPFGRGIGKSGPYWNPTPPAGAPEQAPLTQQELDALLKQARRK